MGRMESSEEEEMVDPLGGSHGEQRIIQPGPWLNK